MAERVMVFVDYQNAYRVARDLYHDAWDPAHAGQFHPGGLGRLLVRRDRFPRTLAGVRIYRGLPSSQRDPRSFGAARAQIAAWSGDQDVTAVSHPIRYPSDWPMSKAEEKGIDVSIAIDFLRGAMKGWYDVGIIMSLDTDLKPALAAVAEDFSHLRVEVAAWAKYGVRTRRLGFPGAKMWCHWIDEDGYRAVQDTTSYVGGA